MGDMNRIKDGQLGHGSYESFSADGDWDVQKKRSPLVMVGTEGILIYWYGVGVVLQSVGVCRGTRDWWCAHGWFACL